MDILLMHKDIKVMKINFDEGLYEILDEKNVPFQLKGKIGKMVDFEDIKSKQDLIERQKIERQNYNAIKSFLASRVLPITRENAKKIYNLFGFEQIQTDENKAKVAITCRAVSLQDDFWIKNENDEVKWADVNLRHNSLSETVAQVSLHGSSLTLQGKIHTPELNGQGAYAKAWKRENNDLYLYKLGTNNKYNESMIEVMVSNLLDNMNVDHIKYVEAFSNEEYACKCKCMTTDNLSILSGLDFISYCYTNNLNPDIEMMKIDKENIYKMWIVDYLISNSDRHGMNWGFFYDSETMEIKGCHPLYDHNNAFDISLMKNKEAAYTFDRNKTMKQAAEYAMKRVDFHFYRAFSRDDFMTKEQYESFIKRAKELNIVIKPKTFSEHCTDAKRIAKMNNKYTTNTKIIKKNKSDRDDR